MAMDNGYDHHSHAHCYCNMCSQFVISSVERLSIATTNATGLNNTK